MKSPAQVLLTWALAQPSQSMVHRNWLALGGDRHVQCVSVPQLLYLVSFWSARL
jgi:hypothetical protein